MLYPGNISCVLGGFGGLEGVAVVNAVFREHFMCVGWFWYPRIWAWSKMVKKSFFGSGNARVQPK